MINLCFGMKVINITQLPGDSYSHPNGAMDLAGADSGIDFWYAMGSWKCIAGPWGNGTYFFAPVDKSGAFTKVHCADGKDRTVTIALTHSSLKYVKTKVGQIYKNGIPMYEEGTKGRATGNHIHYEVAEGLQKTKHYDSKLKVYRMNGELNPLAVTFVDKSFSTIAKNSLGKTKLKTCKQLEVVEAKPKEVRASGVAQSYSRGLTGSYVVTPSVGLVLRDGAGTNKKAMVTMPYGTVCENYGYFTKNTNTWLYVSVVLNNVRYIGFACSKYLRKR